MNYFPKSVFFLLAFVAPVGAYNAAAESDLNLRMEEVEHLSVGVELMAKFHSWTEEHDKTYDSHEEKLKRLQIWVENDGEFVKVVFGFVIIRLVLYHLAKCVWVVLFGYY
jgi:Cathepsin propeptide inhibitor domain (I29)